TEWPFLTNGHGRETALIAPAGGGTLEARPDCHDFAPRTVTDRAYEWFDYDCDYCTGAYDSRAGKGMFHANWNVGAPPPTPGTKSSGTTLDLRSTSRTITTPISRGTWLRRRCPSVSGGRTSVTISRAS